MTFARFTEIATAHRPEITLTHHIETAHGAVVRISFKRENGKPAKVYEYKGSYADILYKLGIDTVEAHEVEEAKRKLEKAKATHGQMGFFGVIDNTAEIARLESLLKHYETCVII